MDVRLLLEMLRRRRQLRPDGAFVSACPCQNVTPMVTRLTAAQPGALAARWRQDLVDRIRRYTALLVPCHFPPSLVKSEPKKPSAPVGLTFCKTVSRQGEEHFAGTGRWTVGQRFRAVPLMYKIIRVISGQGVLLCGGAACLCLRGGTGGSFGAMMGGAEHRERCCPACCPENPEAVWLVAGRHHPKLAKGGAHAPCNWPALPSPPTTRGEGVKAGFPHASLCPAFCPVDDLNVPAMTGSLHLDACSSVPHTLHLLFFACSPRRCHLQQQVRQQSTWKSRCSRKILLVAVPGFPPFLDETPAGVGLRQGSNACICSSVFLAIFAARCRWNSPVLSLVQIARRRQCHTFDDRSGLLALAPTPTRATHTPLATTYPVVGHAPSRSSFVSSSEPEATPGDR